MEWLPWLHFDTNALYSGKSYQNCFKFGQIGQTGKKKAFANQTTSRECIVYYWNFRQFHCPEIERKTKLKTSKVSKMYLLYRKRSSCQTQSKSRGRFLLPEIAFLLKNPERKNSRESLYCQESPKKKTRKKN